MMKIKIVGTEKAVKVLQRKKQATYSQLKIAILKSANAVRSTAMLDYLRGPRPQHLGVVTGNLYRSIRAWTEEGLSRNVIIGKIGTNVWYGRMWELTGHKEILPIHAKKLRWKDAQGKWHTADKVRAQAPRPFLKPALRDNSKVIQNFIREAVNEGVRK